MTGKTEVRIKVSLTALCAAFLPSMYFRLGAVRIVKR
jgi:hypothetical protein